ncbi:MAG: protein kinase [Breznakibacter sp.]
MAELIPAYYNNYVNQGEERLVLFLKANLPGNYYLLPNIEVASTNPRNKLTQYWEYDLLVIAPHAIFCIENKDWKGRLEGDNNYWYLNDRQRQNPLKLGRQKTAILHSKLTDENLAWRNVWVQNMVTLSHPTQAKGNLWQEAGKLTFLLNNELIEFITNSEKTGQKENAIFSIQDDLLKYLSGNQSIKKPEEKKMLLDMYEIIDILDREQNYTEYLVKIKGVTSSIRKRVKEYALQVSDDPNNTLRIQNQFYALNKIKGKSFILNVEFRNDAENNLFYEITDYYDENSLRAELKLKTYTNEQRLTIVFDLITALKAAHEESVYHRDINPENIFIIGGHAYLSNFGKAWFTDHNELGYTVASTINETNATPYHALELLNKEASRASDIYSLGVLIYEIFTQKVPVKNPFELNQLGGKLPNHSLPTAINPNLPLWLDELCNKTILCDEFERFDNLDELESFIREKIKEPATTPKPTKEPEITDSLEYKVGAKIGVYTIYKELGKGGYSRVFQVKHDLTSQVSAMKLFHESVSLPYVISEYEALKSLNHPNIVKFVHIDKTYNGQFFTLMEYLEGENLKEYVQGELKLPSSKIYQAGKDILSALVAMQNFDSPIYHRDIKPQNIVWDKEQRFVLIDFNVATALQTNKEYVGTNPYLAPDLIMDGTKVNWDKSADTFALGITLYELTCKRYPWKNKIPLIGTQPLNPRDINPTVSEKFANFLFKAVQPKKTDRFQDAQQMLDALQSIGIDNLLFTEEPKQEEKGVTTIDTEFIDYLNTLYSQSKFGNAGTRARLNGHSFDNETYIETKLDKQLLPAVLDGNYRLLIITGNAGDGKTAFIRKIEQRASGLIHLEHQNGANFIINDIPFQSNYDGSQDEASKINNEVLNEFFSPFEGLKNFNQAKSGRIIAINEGRLVEFLQSTEKHKYLKEAIEKYFYTEGHAELPDGLMVINLNLRSVVASQNGDESIFRKQIKAFTNKKYWTKCQNCSSSKECYINYNVQTFNDSAAGAEVIHRLEWLLRTVILRRELHITIRDLRSFIAFMITRDKSCDEITELIQKAQYEPERYWLNYYFNITAPARDSAINDRLIELLRETDVAETAVPSDDRDLFFTPHENIKFHNFEGRDLNLLEWFNQQKLFIPSHEQTPELLSLIKRLHKNFIRHQYFEGKSYFFLRIPYHSVKEFCQKLEIIPLEKSKNEEDTIYSISKAISYNEGCDNESVTQKYLVLSPSQVSDPISKSFRLFPLSDFEFKINKTEHLIKYLEYEPDNLLFRHKNDNKIKLEISLDLYEMLYFIQRKFSPSLNDLRGRYIELNIFKNLLENLTYNEVLVSKDNIEFFKIFKQANEKLTIEKFETT